ncbi:MAG TPA: 3'-5' exonuclease, partial [bacterium]|nr:3'-5' exonuclease [bacterium]
EAKLYIGKFGFTHDKKPVITDWRSKIASIYYRYRYPQKNVVYTTPEGEKVRDLILKRTFDIVDGKLNKYFNNDIQLDESEIIAEKIESRTGGILEDIVETIQESQLDIIEADPRTPCVVQGCVGSGKSTVAIHKLSHIFFNFPKLITPERSILVAKSQILVSYLSTLFPKLGIFDIKYKTLSDLVYNLMFREEMPVIMDLEMPTDPSNMGFEFLSILQEQVAEVSKKTKEQLKSLFEKEEFSSFGGYKYEVDLTPYENIASIKEDLQEELETSVTRLKENPKSTRAWLYKMNSDILGKIITQLGKIQNDLKNKDLPLVAKALGIPKKGNISYSESLAYAFLHINIIGFNKDKTLKYQYCVVDEGQDFSPLEYAVLNSFILHKRLCILGDLNQGFVTSAISSWDDLEKILGTSNIKHFTLDTNYRSTAPIINLANKILSPFTDKYLPKSINRKGEEPSFTAHNSSNEMFAKIKIDLQQDAQEFKKSIGIITYDQNSFNTMQEILNKLDIEEERKMILDSDKRIDYKPRAIYLTKFENCKGLEFGKVYIVNKNPLENNSYEEAKKSFVGVTRAMDKISIYYVK